MAAKINRAAIDAVIRRNLRKLKKPGAMTARLGYMMTGGLMTDKPAVVVTVDRKVDGLPARDLLPKELEDVPVDVREATGLQRLRQSDPAAHALIVSHGRNEWDEPDWPLERNVSNGRLVPKSEKKPLSVQGKAVAKTSIKYAAPAGRPLDPVTRRMTIVASVSPDDGYPVLTEFLAGVQTRLTAAMYDFTSADILKAVEKAIKPDARPFEMVIDHPPRNPTANQSDEETRAALVAVDSHGEVNWALTRNDPQASEWIYPTAYHIKVAVRDGAAFWLSSGNWNVSNQPNFAAKDPKRGNEPTADRDWHVVVMDPELAALYEAYIRNDFQVAAPHQNAGNPATLTTIQAALKKYSVAQKRSSPGRGSQRASNNSHVPHKIFENVPVTVQPLLTPDPGTHTTLYVDRVLALIKSAKKSIYMQTQYIHPSDKPADKDFMLLVDAMATAHKSGLDVRVITSQFENTPQWVETLVQHDLVDALRIQQAVHNKGIVVDSATVMISSENWSADGTLRNRDAGVIIKNADIAHYFERVFLDDWVNRASKKLKDPSPPAPVAKKP